MHVGWVFEIVQIILIIMRLISQTTNVVVCVGGIELQFIS